MKYATPELIALLATGGPFLMADLYTLTLQTGDVYRWCGSDTDITYEGNLYTAAIDGGGQPIIERGPIRSARGLEVNTLDLTLYPGDGDMLLGINLRLAIHNGALDGARIRVERAFMPTWGETFAGAALLFEGSVAGVEAGVTQVVVHAKDDLENLQVQMPKTLFAPACANAFGDISCGIDLASLTITAAVTGDSTASVLYGAPGHADNYFQTGVVTFTTGACAGASCAVSAYVGGVLTLVTPLPATPAVDDVFKVSPGCPRTKEACAGFGNSTRFRGCPFIPNPETTR